MVTSGDEVARFYATIGADTSGLTRGTALARAEMASLGASATTSASSARNAFTGIGSGIALGLGVGAVAAVGGALQSAVKSAISYETAFTGVRRTVAASEEDYAKLDSTIRRMATTTLPIGREELARIATIGGQMNIPIEAMESFIDTVARFSVSTQGVLDPAGAAAGLGKLLPLLGLSIDDANELAAALGKAADAGLGNEAQVIDIALRSAAAQRIAGFSAAQTLALAGVGPQLGNDEAIGTALATVPIQLSKIVQEGGKDLEALARISGVTAEEFKRQWGEDAYGAFLLFIQGVGQAGESSFQVLDDLGLGGIRVSQAILGLSTVLPELSVQLELSNEQLRTGAYLAEESAKAFGTTASELSIFKSNLTELGGEMGGPFVEAMNVALPYMSEFVRQLKLVADGNNGEGWLGAFATGVIATRPGGGGVGALGNVTDAAGDALKTLFGPQPSADAVTGRRDYSTHPQGSSEPFDSSRGPTYVVNGNVNVGVNPSVPGGIDPNAAISVVGRVDYQGEGRYAE